MGMIEMLNYFEIATKKVGKKIYILNDSLFRECWQTLKDKPKLESINKVTHKITVTVYIINRKKYIENKT